MLAFRPQNRLGKKTTRGTISWPTDEEAGFAQPTEPIPIVLVRDREPSLAYNHTHEASLANDVESEHDLPAPPPVYGNWRSSVVCLPIHPPPPPSLLKSILTNPAESRPQSHPLAAPHQPARRAARG